MTTATAHPFGFLKPGATIDSFRIVRALGEGAYGLVLLVKRRGRQFALKLARRREVSDDAARTDARMMRELGCLIHLEHPNIIRARAWGRFPDLIGDYCYLVLDYVDGWTLAEWLETTRPSFVQVTRVFVKLASALDYMHRRGVFHRDISLTNILIRKDDGEPFIVDFGSGDFANAYDLTDAPVPPGTNRFRAPEAMRFWREHRTEWGVRYDFRAADEQFALAACLYDALTDAETAKDAEKRAAPRISINSPLVGTPPAPRVVNPRVPQALSALVTQAVEHDAAKRLPTLEDLRNALEAVADGGGVEWEAAVFEPASLAPRATPERAARREWGRRRKWAAVGAAVVAAAAALTLLRDASQPPASPNLPAPAGAPHARAPQRPPSPAETPAVEVPSGLVAPAQKESPTMSAPTPSQRQPPPKKQRPPPRTFTPEFLARCAGLGLAAAAQAGCPGPQVRPERDSCPAEALEGMEKVDAGHGDIFYMMLDVNQPGAQSELGVYRTGRYMGEIRYDVGPIPGGTLVEGQIWTEGKTVVGRFTRLFLPAGAKDRDGIPLPREVPVCIVLYGVAEDGGLPKEPGSKPGAVVLRRSNSARFITGKWPQP